MIASSGSHRISESHGYVHDNADQIMHAEHQMKHTKYVRVANREEVLNRCLNPEQAHALAEVYD